MFTKKFGIGTYLTYINDIMKKKFSLLVLLLHGLIVNIFELKLIIKIIIIGNNFNELILLKLGNLTFHIQLFFPINLNI